MNDLSNVNWSNLLVVCAAALGLFFFSVDTASLTGSVLPWPPVYGREHVLRCEFSLGTGENVEGLKLYLGNQTNPSMVVAQIITSTGEVLFSAAVPNGLKSRGTVLGSVREGHLSFSVTKTECEDRNMTYLCFLEYARGNVLQQPFYAIIKGLSKLNVPPRDGLEITRTPKVEFVKEGSQMTFLCSGNVGRPAGELGWFQYLGTSNDKYELTSEAQTDSPKLSEDNCTFTRRSNVTLNMLHQGSGDEESQQTIVECWVEHPVVAENPMNASCSQDSDHCQRTSPIFITNTDASSDGSISVYVIVTLCVVAVLVVAMLSLFIIKKCRQKRRRESAELYPSDMGRLPFEAPTPAAPSPASESAADSHSAVGTSTSDDNRSEVGGEAATESVVSEQSEFSEMQSVVTDSDAAASEG